MYVCIHICMYACMHTYTCIDIDVYIDIAYIHICMYVYIYTSGYYPNIYRYIDKKLYHVLAR